MEASEEGQAVSEPPLPESPLSEDFAAWVRPHLQVMANLAVRLAGPADRDDVVQESLLRAWQRWDTYRPARGTPKVWLLTIVADRARRGRRRPPTGWAGPSLTVDNQPDVDLEAAISSLPNRQRLAVELYYLLDLTVADAATVMGCSVGTVKSALSDARAKLRTQLGES